MPFSIFFSIIIAFATFAPAYAETPEEVSKKDFSYSFGIVIGQSMIEQGLDHNELNTKEFVRGLEAILKNKDVKWSDQQARMQVMTKLQKIQEQRAEKYAQEHAIFFETNAKKTGVISLPSGVQYIILQEGNGEKVKDEDTIQVHYTGSLVDGSIFDSSVDRNQPAILGVNQVIPGWQEILPKMKVGSKWKIFIPPSLGYGANQAGSIPPHSILIFEIEILAIEQ